MKDRIKKEYGCFNSFIDSAENLIYFLYLSIAFLFFPKEFSFPDLGKTLRDAEKHEKISQDKIEI